MELNVNQWISRYQRLSPVSKIKVLKALSEEIKNIDTKTDKLQLKVTNQEEIEKLKKAIVIFNELPDEEKIVLTNNFIANIEYRSERYQRKKEIESCAMIGHKFTKWQREVINDPPEFIESDIIVKINIGNNNILTTKEKRYYKKENSHIVWHRYCKNCHLYQKTSSLEEVLKDDAHKKRKKRY